PLPSQVRGPLVVTVWSGCGPAGTGPGRTGTGWDGIGPSDRGRHTSSLRAFRGMALTTLRAGFALIVIGSLVNGLIPCLALVAGRRTTLSLSRPGTVNRPGPFLLSSWP